MRYCLFRSFCEPSPSTFEEGYRCCNDCSNKKCSNRCKDDCSSCNLSTDLDWVIEQRERLSPKVFLSQSKSGKKAESVEKPITPPEGQVVKTPAESKKEARRRRRLARKAKAKANPLS